MLYKSYATSKMTFLSIISIAISFLSKTATANPFLFSAFISQQHQAHHRHLNDRRRRINLQMTKKATSSSELPEGETPRAQDQEWDVERYQNQHSFVWKYGASLVDLIVIEPGDRILDVGCGSGELTAELYTKAQEMPAAADEESSSPVVMGMDSSAEMIATASTQYPHLNFFQGDVRNFELPRANDSSDDDDDSKVDVIFSNAALHWVPPRDVDKAVGAMSRALAKGGRLIVEFGGKGNVEKITQAVRDVHNHNQQDGQGEDGQPIRRLPHDYHGWYFPSIADFTSVLEKHGIEVTSATLYDRPTPLDDGIHGLSNWLRMFGSHLLSVEQNNNGTDDEEDDHEQIIRQVHELLMKRGELWNDEQQQWTADYRRIRVVGHKISTPN